MSRREKSRALAHHVGVATCPFIYLSFDGQCFEDTGLFLNYVPISNETSVTQVSVQTFATELIGGSFEKGPSETTWLPVINQTFFAGVSTNSTLTVFFKFDVSI